MDTTVPKGAVGAFLALTEQVISERRNGDCAHCEPAECPLSIALDAVQAGRVSVDVANVATEKMQTIAAQTLQAAGSNPFALIAAREALQASIGRLFAVGGPLEDATKAQRKQTARMVIDGGAGYIGLTPTQDNTRAARN